MRKTTSYAKRQLFMWRVTLVKMHKKATDLGNLFQVDALFLRQLWFPSAYSLYFNQPADPHSKPKTLQAHAIAPVALHEFIISTFMLTRNRPWTSFVTDKDWFSNNKPKCVNIDQSQTVFNLYFNNFFWIGELEVLFVVTLCICVPKEPWALVQLRTSAD